MMKSGVEQVRDPNGVMMFWNEDGPFAGWVCVTNLTVMDEDTAEAVRKITSKPNGADFKMDRVGTLMDVQEGMKLIHTTLSLVAEAWSDGSMFKIDPVTAGIFVAGGIGYVNNSSEAKE